MHRSPLIVPGVRTASRVAWALAGAALVTSLSASALAQEYGDPSAMVDPSDPTGYVAPQAVTVDPNAGGGLSVVNGSPGQPVDESATYDDGYDPTAYAQFESELSAYGEWFDDPQYGRVWSPSPAAVGADFAPYATGGHWSLTQYGWTWASDYPWGWAPFHYGRWVTLASRGWAWVPGTVWGPAWVSWRTGGGYAGWAPLPPAGVPLAAPSYGASWWQFLPVQQLGALRPSYLPWSSVSSIYPRTAWANPARTMTFNQRVVRYNPGPLGMTGPSAMRVGPLLPNAIPRPNIAPRVGVPMGARPWMGGSGYRPNGNYAQPTYGAVPYGGQGGYRPPVYVQPGYARPGYAQPGYAQPTYGVAPPGNTQPGYGQSGYGQPGYAQPTYRPAQPAYPTPQWGGGGGGRWGGGGGGHWGGGRRR
jgi:hypothetical protein